MLSLVPHFHLRFLGHSSYYTKLLLLFSVKDTDWYSEKPSPSRNVKEGDTFHKMNVLFCTSIQFTMLDWLIYINSIAFKIPNIKPKNGNENIKLNEIINNINWVIVNSLSWFLIYFNWFWYVNKRKIIYY